MISDIRIVEIARTAHEANRAYCEQIGDTTQKRWNDAADWQRQSAIDGVKAVLDGRVKKPADAHESWLEAKLDEGWAYGKVKDPDKKLHPCILPHDELPAEQQVKGVIFFSVVTGMIRVSTGL